MFHAASWLAQRLDVRDQVVDLGSGQRQIRHGPMRMRQKSAELVGAHPALGNRDEGRRALRDCARLTVADDVAVRAPPLRNSAAG